MTGKIPHLRVVVSVSAFVLVGFAVVSGYVIGWSHDEVTKGNIIGTWQNFALLAVGFWIGSSSGGKTKDSEPIETRITNPPSDPVNTTTTAESKADEIGDLPRPMFGDPA